jgi:glycosyltransferase involved in cell wall biosynthesis
LKEESGTTERNYDREKQMDVIAFDGSLAKFASTAPKCSSAKRKLLKLMRIPIKLFEVRDKLPTICVIGRNDLRLVTPIQEDYEERRLDCRCYPLGTDLEKILIQDRPHVIITIGNRSSFPDLLRAPFEIRKRWLHYDTLPDLTQLGRDAYNCYLKNIFNGQGADDNPLITVFTPTYRTGERIYRPFLSLMEQTYKDWEWIIVDDSDDDGRTFKMLGSLAKKDHRIHVFKPWEHSGMIGKLKNWACSLGKGQILVELDHDDELTDYATDYVVRGFKQFPEAGFLYTDCAEVYENGTPHSYRKGWAFGYGSYTDVEYKGKLYKSGSAGNINAKTIRHIVSSPNHIRAWRRSFYESIGGHNTELHVADDYELMVRTFLKTRIIRVPMLCYIQYIGSTAQQSRNKDIHRHVRSIRAHYDRMIHDRFLELGCEDFIWDETSGYSDFNIPNPEVEPHVTLTAAM